MQKEINQLIQLQELIMARAQHEAAGQTNRLEELDQAIETMRTGISEDSARIFGRLLKKDALCIVPVYNKACTACGMVFPTSYVQTIRNAATLNQCTNCSRLLYYSESLPHGIQEKRKRYEPPKVGISRFTSAQLMITDLQGTTAEEVLGEMAAKMQEEGFVEDGAKLKEEALKREAIVSTAVEGGIAFPHVRGVVGGGLTVCLGLSKKGVKFGADGNKLTRIFFFIAIPTAASAFYLKLLAGLTKAFREKETRDALFEAENNEQLFKKLAKATRYTVT